MSGKRPKLIREAGPYAYHNGVPDNVEPRVQGGVYWVQYRDNGTVRRVYSNGNHRQVSPWRKEGAQ